jgi:hypothetical protein
LGREKELLNLLDCGLYKYVSNFNLQSFFRIQRAKIISEMFSRIVVMYINNTNSDNNNIMYITRIKDVQLSLVAQYLEVRYYYHSI